MLGITGRRKFQMVLNGIIFGKFIQNFSTIIMKQLLFTFLFLFGFIYCSAQTKSTPVSFSGYVDGYYVQASGKLIYHFSWAVTPEVKAEFSNLEVTRIDYEGVQYDYLKNNKYINFPYSCSGYSTLTEIKCSMPYNGFNTVSKNLYSTSGLTGFDFTTESFKKKYNSETTERQNQIQRNWKSSPYIYDANILELNRSLINSIINDIKRSLEEETKEKELKKKKEEKRLADLKKEEIRKKEEKEKRLAELEKEKERKKQEKEKREKEKREKEKKEKEKEKQKDKVDNSYKFERYAEATAKARQYESNGNISEAIRWYKIALSYSYNHQIENKVKVLEQQQDLNTIASGTAYFITGMNEAFANGSKERIKRIIMSSSYHVSKSTFDEDQPSKSSKVHLEAHLGLDWYFWLVKEKVAFHSGFFGDYTSIDDESPEFSDNRWFFDVEKIVLGNRSGINLFGRFEIDYVFRGLKLKGEYSHIDPNYTGIGDRYLDIPYGGKLQFDGGLRAAVFLANRSNFIVRASGWYINGSGEGMLSMVDPVPEINTSYTRSSGLRLEIIRAPWAFGIFRTSHFYNNSLTNDLTMNTWGVGVLFGGGG